MGIFGTLFQIHCSVIDQEITPQTLVKDYQEFKDYLKKLSREIKLLQTAQGVLSYVPFGSRMLDNKVKKEAEKRGYDEFSQRLIPIGELFFTGEWNSHVKNAFLKPPENYIFYLNTCRNKIKEKFDLERENDGRALNRSIKIMHKIHIDQLVQENKLEQKKYFYKNNLEDNGKCAFYNFLIRYKEEHGELPVYVLLNMYMSFWFAKNGLITEIQQ
jgi:hypothetical protein